MANLYELMGDYAALQDAIDAGASDEEIGALIATMDDAKGTLKTKVDNVCRVLRNIAGKVTAVKNEEKRLGARRKALENNKERLRSWVRESMDVLDVPKIKTDLNNVTLGDAGDTVTILDINKVPDEYKTKQDPKPLKKAILKAYEDDGEIIPGTDIVKGVRPLTIL